MGLGNKVVRQQVHMREIDNERRATSFIACAMIKQAGGKILLSKKVLESLEPGVEFHGEPQTDGSILLRVVEKQFTKENSAFRFIKGGFAISYSTFEGSPELYIDGWRRVFGPFWKKQSKPE